MYLEANDNDRYSLQLIKGDNLHQIEENRQGSQLDSFATPDLPDELEYQFNGINAL